MPKYLISLYLGVSVGSSMNVCRKIKRFRVATSSFPLKVSIPQSLTKFYALRTLGEGGFGCLVPFKDAGLVQQDSIDVRFMLGEKTITFKGQVRYCTFLPKQGASYLGVSFSDVDARQELLLKTIIQGALQKGHLVGEA